MWLTRFQMYREISTTLGSPMRGDILGISGLEYFLPMIDQAESHVLDVHYPSIDIQAMPFRDESFDFVISDQVIEHVPAPWKAMDESARVLRSGGLAIHTSCLLNPIHLAPNDYFRFTEWGLKAMLPTSMEVVVTGSWGNRLAIFVIHIWDRLRNIEIPDRRSALRWLATAQEPEYPIVTWVIARKMATKTHDA